MASVPYTIINLLILVDGNYSCDCSFIYDVPLLSNFLILDLWCFRLLFFLSYTIPFLDFFIILQNRLLLLTLKVKSIICMSTGDRAVVIDIFD